MKKTVVLAAALLLTANLLTVTAKGAANGSADDSALTYSQTAQAVSSISESTDGPDSSAGLASSIQQAGTEDDERSSAMKPVMMAVACLGGVNIVLYWMNRKRRVR